MEIKFQLNIEGDDGKVFDAINKAHKKYKEKWYQEWLESRDLMFPDDRYGPVVGHIEVENLDELHSLIGILIDGNCANNANLWASVKSDEIYADIGLLSEKEGNMRPDKDCKVGNVNLIYGKGNDLLKSVIEAVEILNDAIKGEQK
jgi:hypothetical protein